MDSRFSRLLQAVQPHYDNGDPGHDFAHVKRVMNAAKRIAEDVGADLNIVMPAALLHDVINVPKNSPDRIAASAKASEAAKIHLRAADYNEAEIERICTVILEHSYSLVKAPSSLESAVMQDADRLDALGAVGMMRTTSCGVKMGARYYDPDEPIAQTRALDDKVNTLDHVYVKLLKLAAKMNTDIGKREAKKRTEFMLAFMTQVASEIDGRFV
jgi:uncharacterized protein